jgi:hypothetical protein
MSEVDDTVERSKIPACTVADQESIDRYLQYMLDRLEFSYNEHVATYLTAPSSHARGMVDHLRARVQTTKWLIAVNQQRKPRHEGKGARGARI